MSQSLELVVRNAEPNLALQKDVTSSLSLVPVIKEELQRARREIITARDEAREKAVEKWNAEGWLFRLKGWALRRYNDYITKREDEDLEVLTYEAQIQNGEDLIRVTKAVGNLAEQYATVQQQWVDLLKQEKEVSERFALYKKNMFAYKEELIAIAEYKEAFERYESLPEEDQQKLREELAEKHTGLIADISNKSERNYLVTKLAEAYESKRREFGKVVTDVDLASTKLKALQRQREDIEESGTQMYKMFIHGMKRAMELQTQFETLKNTRGKRSAINMARVLERSYELSTQADHVTGLMALEVSEAEIHLEALDATYNTDMDPLSEEIDKLGK